MQITIELNGKKITDDVAADMVLLDFCRKHKCFSVKRGCETGNCGLCTVMMDDVPVLSCGVPVGRADGHRVQTLEGLSDEALEFTDFLAVQGADQCGFCNPGFIVNTIALFREYENPTDDEIRSFLAGNLCRCTGYESQLRALRNFLNARNGRESVKEHAGVYGEDIGKEWKYEGV